MKKFKVVNGKVYKRVVQTFTIESGQFVHKNERKRITTKTTTTHEKTIISVYDMPYHKQLEFASSGSDKMQRKNKGRKRMPK